MALKRGVDIGKHEIYSSKPAPDVVTRDSSGNFDSVKSEVGNLEITIPIKEVN